MVVAASQNSDWWFLYLLQGRTRERQIQEKLELVLTHHSLTSNSTLDSRPGRLSAEERDSSSSESLLLSGMTTTEHAYELTHRGSGQSAGFKVAANTGLPVVKSGLIKSAVCCGEVRELGAGDSRL